MLKNFNDFLFESSSLNSIDVPLEVMQIVQYDFEFQQNISWIKSNKNDIVMYSFVTGRHKYSNLFVGVSDDKIFFLFSYNLDNNVVYNYDEFNRIEDDFGDGWERNTENDLNFNNILPLILKFGGKIWFTPNDNYEISSKIERKMKSFEKSLEETTEKFKYEVIQKLNKLDIEISNRIGANGLSEFDEYLLNFEEKYSELYKKHITIEYLIEEHGIDKIITWFVYFIKTDNIVKTLNEKIITVGDKVYPSGGNVVLMAGNPEII